MTGVCRRSSRSSQNRILQEAFHNIHLQPLHKQTASLALVRQLPSQLLPTSLAVYRYQLQQRQTQPPQTTHLRTSPRNVERRESLKNRQRAFHPNKIAGKPLRRRTWLLVRMGLGHGRQRNSGWCVVSWIRESIITLSSKDIQGSTQMRDLPLQQQPTPQGI